MCFEHPSSQSKKGKVRAPWLSLWWRAARDPVSQKGLPRHASKGQRADVLMSPNPQPGGFLMQEVFPLQMLCPSTRPGTGWSADKLYDQPWFT